MEKDDESILDLVGEIYEASIKPARWPVVLERLAALTRAKSAVMLVHDRDIKQMNVCYTYGLPKIAVAYLNSPIGALDPGLRIMREQPQGKAVNMYRLDDESKIPRVFHAMVSRLTDLFYFGGVHCIKEEDWNVGIGLHRIRAEGEFEPATLALVEALVPHLKRALRIQKELSRLQLRQQTLQAELNRHILGLVLLNEEGKPLYMNPMATRILAQHGAIMLRDNALHGYAKGENEKFQQAIRKAASMSPSDVEAGEALGLNHPDHAMPLVVLVVPSNNELVAEGLPAGRSTVAVYITDPEVTTPIADEALMKVYGLSKREARVAVAIANGHDVTEIAKLHRVSVETVRSQMKSTFRKTGVNRQADLIRLLLGGPFGYVESCGKGSGSNHGDVRSEHSAPG